MSFDIAVRVVEQAPDWFNVGSALIGTAVGGLITAVSNWWLQRGRSKAEDKQATTQDRRVHERWLREQRFAVYRNFIVDADLMARSVRGTTGSDFEFTPEDYQQMLAAVSAVGLVGPNDLYDLAKDYQDVAVRELDAEDSDHVPDWAALVHARTKVATRMQEIIGVPKAERFGEVRSTSASQ